MVVEPNLIVKDPDWLSLSMTRTGGQLQIWAKVDPRVEAFMSSQGEGTDPLTAYGRSWAPLDPNQPINVYKVADGILNEIYSINAICGELTLLSQKKVGGEIINLSFLRFQGLSSPDGIRFVVTAPTPFDRDYIRRLNRNILLAAQQLFKNYIVPINVVLSISSTEF